MPTQDKTLIMPPTSDTPSTAKPQAECTAATALHGYGQVTAYSAQQHQNRQSGESCAGWHPGSRIKPAILPPNAPFVPGAVTSTPATPRRPALLQPCFLLRWHLPAPPAPPASSYLPPSSGTQQDSTHTQCCSHLLITTRGRAFETQSSKTGDSFAPIPISSLHCFSIQDSTSWWPTLRPPSIASPLGQTTSLLGETDGKVGWTPYTYNTNNPKCDTDIKGWLVGPDTSRGVGGLASLSSSPCPHTNSPWSFYNKEGGFTVDSEIDVRLTNVP